MARAFPAFLLILSACATPALPVEELYFAAQGPSESRLLWLRADGSFSHYWRTHLTLEERGQGRWRRESDGSLALQGPWRRFVVVGPLTVIGHAEHGGPGFREIRHAIAGVLDHAPGRITFPADQLRETAEWQGESTIEGKDDRWVAASIVVANDSVTRRELTAVIAALDAFPTSHPADEVRVRLEQSGSHDFLYWPEGGPGWTEDPLDELKAAVKAGRSPASFSAIFLRIDAARFEKAAPDLFKR